MSKKKLLILPLIVLVIFSIMGFTAFADIQSPTNDTFEVYENDGKGGNITNKFNGEKLLTDDGFSLSSVSGLQDKIKKYDKELKVSDFKFKTGADIFEKDPGATGGKNWRIYLTSFSVPKGHIAIMVHVNAQGAPDVRVFKGNGKANNAYIDGIKSCSPFYLYTAKAKSSAQTGDFVPAYVAMIAVALMSCGAIFAIRAKKASK
jgi:hypothetical protein